MTDQLDQIDTPNTPAALRTLRDQFAELGRQTDTELALARAKLAERLGRPGAPATSSRWPGSSN